jgi:hypothetical protein
LLQSADAKDSQEDLMLIADDDKEFRVDGVEAMGKRVYELLQSGI